MENQKKILQILSKQILVINNSFLDGKYIYTLRTLWTKDRTLLELRICSMLAPSAWI